MDCFHNSSLNTNTPEGSAAYCSGQNLAPISRQSSWQTSKVIPCQQDDDVVEESFESVKHGYRAAHENAAESLNTLDNITALGLGFDTQEDQCQDSQEAKRFSLDDIDIPAHSPLLVEPGQPTNKWMKSLHKRAIQRRKTISGNNTALAFDKEPYESPTRRLSHHKKSSSSSSFGFVTAVKSASISLASLSIAARSRGTGVSSRHQRADRSSKISNARRLSEDSAYLARGTVVDQAVTNRLIQRRKVLEELISTEESYVADIRFLMNVYVTLLASVPSLSAKMKASITRNLNEIVDLHEELLGELHRVVPHSEYTQGGSAEPILPPNFRRHHRWRSLDAVSEHPECPAWLKSMPGMVAEPKVAAEVAKAFARKMNKFFLYEEYGAKYEMMMKDLASTYRTIPQWEIYQKGLEAMASSLASTNVQVHGSKKAITVGDLLVKPIQRVCKYPLLFVELLKQTPVCDCPSSHIEIESVLIRLREATNEINRATDDPRMKIAMERSWLLQDRLIFPDMPDTRSKSSVRSLGNVNLCGVLHISWQTRDAVVGKYLICLLYRDFMVLASAPKNDQEYIVQACMGLNELRLEEIDNGRGIQCHTAPFSWKVLFEYDHQLFEITMSACSSKEEQEWRSRLNDRLCKDASNSGEQAALRSLFLQIRPMGTVFGKPGTIARKISIHRASTLGPKSTVCQVIIKNTTAFKESASSASINRSQSLLTTNRITVLAPPRAERVRLESLLADTWTRDILPFPGMAGRARSELIVRASASSLMRKLSVASITSNFTKYSGSMASLHRTKEDEEQVETNRTKTASNIIEHQSSESIVRNEEAITSRLSMMQDEKENLPKPMLTDSHSALPSSGRPSKALRRFATVKIKTDLGLAGQRAVAHPLRTSSANNVNQSRSSLLSPDPDTRISKENAIQVPRSETTQSVLRKCGRKGRKKGMNRGAVAEGLRNLL